MVKMFDFSHIENSKRAIRKTWNEFRNCLANKQFRYDEIDTALSITFLRVFDDLFSYGHYLLEKNFVDVLGDDISIVRAARIKDGEPLPTYERFIPNAKYIRNSNRFSPPGIEWLYLAIAPLNDTEKLSLEDVCALKECRANAGEQFALCQFKRTYLNKDGLLIDLTIAKETEYDDLNRHLEQEGQRLVQKEVRRIMSDYFNTGLMQYPQTGGIVSAFTKWAV